jgi:hypothetical protein
LSQDTLPVRPRVTGGFFNRPWVLIFLTAVIGVPSVILGLFLVALVIANPITWFLAGAAWFAIGFRHYRHRLTIRDTPSSRIHAAAIGLVEVSGRVRARGATETAPISGTPCIHWHVTIESRHELPNNQGHKTSTVFDKQSTTPSFEIEDATGQVVVWPWAAEMIVTDRTRWEGHAAWELGQRLSAGPIRDILTREGGHDLTVTEHKVEIGKTLYVIGVLSERHRVFRPKPFRERVHDRFQPDYARTSHSAVETLKMLLLASAMVVGGLATGQVIMRFDKTSPLDSPPEMDPQQVVIWRGEKDRPFIIADSPEGIVVNTLTQWTKLGLFGGAGVMVGTVILYLGGFFS